jgi:hypothetical protein
MNGRRFHEARWRKSSTSGDSSCVEVARMGDRIGVRDAKARGTGAVLEFTLDEWMAFTEGVVNGEFAVDRLDR